jgi:hypothetical protein
MVATSLPGGGGGLHNASRQPARRPLGAQEGDRRRPHRPASTARRIFFRHDEVPCPSGGVCTPSVSKPLEEGRSRARGPDEASAAPPRPANNREASAAAPRPTSAAGSSAAGKRPGEQRLGRGGGAEVAESSSDARSALLQRFSELFGDPRFSHRRWGKRLDRALARLDRYADFGAGRVGAGLEVALGLIETEAEEVRWRRRKRPASLAYFIPVLEEMSKDWRRKQAPRSASAPAGWRASWAHPKKKPARGRAARRHNTRRR